VQGPAAPRPRVGEDLARVQRHKADQQPGAGPPVQAVLSHCYLGIVHVDRIVPVVVGEAGQQPPQRRDPHPRGPHPRVRRVPPDHQDWRTLPAIALVPAIWPAFVV
jgi:hypothetical protein